MPATLEVHFKGIRKGFYRWKADGEPPRLREAVIVEADRGMDCGRVSAVGEAAASKCAGCSGCAVGEVDQQPLMHVVRLATGDDIRQMDGLRRGEEDVRRRVAERVRVGGLDLKVSDAEWQWDKKKLTVYFTAEQRVDFRSLVRELAAQYRARIDLRQIGARDEAARIGGVGRCGREYCCSTWLTELSPVSLGLAKDQHLSLNPAQISGGCGRLLCCLRYEHEFYVAARRRFPKEGKTLRTAQGAERVVAVDIFRERVFLRSEEHGHRTVLLTDLRAELDALGEVLPVPPERVPRPATPVAAAPAPPISPAGADRRKRRRRKRRRGPGEAPPPAGAAGET
jgi:cell fate regulator YaaT (PSP1 superfamily)